MTDDTPITRKEIHELVARGFASIQQKLDSIEEGAQVNPTGLEIVDAVNATLGTASWQTTDSHGDTIEELKGKIALLEFRADALQEEANPFTAAEKSKLQSIEFGAEQNTNL